VIESRSNLDPTFFR